MNHKEEYERKLVNAEDAVRVVKSGDWVDYGHFTCAPTYLDAALARRASRAPRCQGPCAHLPGHCGHRRC